MIRALVAVLAAGCAASYFVGEITITDGVIGGTEQWVLFPNEKWKALGATDCRITWALTGTVTTPAKCQGCDLGLRIHAEPDRASSTCPKELVYGRDAPTGQKVGGEANPFDVQYDVRRSPDGSAAFHFGSSGAQFATGSHTADRLSFTSNRQCKWF